MKGMITVGALLATSGMAFGQLSPTGQTYTSHNGGEAGSYTNSRGGGTLVNVDVTGIQSWDALSDPSNTVVNFDVAAALGLPSGTAVTMTGVSWDVSVATEGASWLSEARVYFDDNLSPDLYGLFLTPGVADSFPGSGSYSSGGVLDLSDNGIPDIALPNGMLRLEFNESFDDISDAVDANWTAGNFGIQAVPAPGALALLGLGGLVAGRRRR